MTIKIIPLSYMSVVYVVPSNLCARDSLQLGVPHWSLIVCMSQGHLLRFATAAIITSRFFASTVRIAESERVNHGWHAGSWDSSSCFIVSSRRVTCPFLSLQLQSSHSNTRRLNCDSHCCVWSKIWCRQELCAKPSLLIGSNGSITFLLPCGSIRCISWSARTLKRGLCLSHTGIAAVAI